MTYILLQNKLNHSVPTPHFRLLPPKAEPLSLGVLGDRGDGVGEDSALILGLGAGEYRLSAEFLEPAEEGLDPMESPYDLGV